MRWTHSNEMQYRKWQTDDIWTAWRQTRQYREKMGKKRRPTFKTKTKTQNTCPAQVFPFFSSLINTDVKDTSLTAPWTAGCRFAYKNRSLERKNAAGIQLKSLVSQTLYKKSSSLPRLLKQTSFKKTIVHKSRSRESFKREVCTLPFICL